jgi:hypothetical protein
MIQTSSPTFLLSSEKQIKKAAKGKNLIAAFIS